MPRGPLLIDQAHNRAAHRGCRCSAGGDVGAGAAGLAGGRSARERQRTHQTERYRHGDTSDAMRTKAGGVGDHDPPIGSTATRHA